MVESTANREGEATPARAGLRDQIKQLYQRDKEITKAWRKRARNMKVYRILCTFAIMTIFMIALIPALNKIFSYFTQPTTNLGPEIVMAWFLNVMTTMTFGVTMLIAILFACYIYKQLVNEICLILPGFSIALAIILSWFHIVWMHVITNMIRQFVPDNLTGIYDFVIKYAGPIVLIYVSAVFYFVSFLTYSIRIQLHRGFRKYGDKFREHDYYKEFASSDAEPWPPVREQWSRLVAEFRRRKNNEPPPDDEDSGVVDSTRRTLRSVFPKDF